MAHTIPTAVSSLGDAFEAMLLDSERVTQIEIAADATVTHELREDTTLVEIFVPADASASSVAVFRGDVFNPAKAWPLVPGYIPRNVPGGSRTLIFTAAADAIVTIQEN
ncbi:hypothetical protein E0H39_29650 [Rhizobium leguminosarum bv. viciae]|uniref:hypothetical protein n=1 Tax=Rhizobium leguminosarum TaxID=384 RepID=UPI00103F24CB|nr:hypothetical protein [Rhizobium leguminosarum]TBY57983.1 hypothetical protein E0H39_29650 [Rhizobium leguminosarum bv. viciae]